MGHVLTCQFLFGPLIAAKLTRKNMYKCIAGDLNTFSQPPEEPERKPGSNYFSWELGLRKWKMRKQLTALCTSISV